MDWEDSVSSVSFVLLYLISGFRFPAGIFGKGFRVAADDKSGKTQQQEQGGRGKVI